LPFITDNVSKKYSASTFGAVEEIMLLGILVALHGERAGSVSNLFFFDRLKVRDSTFVRNVGNNLQITMAS
jgi:hypothetical protein